MLKKESIDPNGPDADLAMELAPGMRERRMSKMVHQDKVRAIVKRNKQIARLKQEIKKLENENKEERRFMNL